MRSGYGLSHGLLAAALLLAAACGEEPKPPPEADPTSLRSLPQGQVVGLTTELGAHAWRGLPFARPPSGELRWRAPQPPEDWEGTREALAFGAPCAQFAGPMSATDAEDGAPSGSEDCLYINVFAPRFAPDEVPTGAARRPVLFWIHGGGNTIGDASLYDASTLARERDVVVVTTHYRLGAFGWFSHPALREGASAPDASGNYGTLDLVRALAWVRRNIAAFGGDPDRVTIFGESAGGSNVFSLLLSPSARGLFQRAIAQSGSAATMPRAEAENFVDDAEPGHPFSSGEVLLTLLEREGLAEGREAGKAKLAAMSSAEIAALLRGQSAAEILSLYRGSRLGGMYRAPRLIRDGRVLPRGDPLQAFRRRGGSNEVPVILGTNRDEQRLFLLAASEYVRRIGPVPLGLKNERMYFLMADYQSLMWKARGADEPAAAMRALRGDVYAYRFDWDDERDLLWLDLGELLGAAHGMEVPFVFGTLRLAGAERFVFDPERRASDVALMNAITSYWTRFAATGDPGQGRDGDLPRWEQWHGPRGGFLILDSDHDVGIRMSDDTVTRRGLFERVATDPRFESTEERCAVYGQFTQRERDMTREEYAAVLDGACAGIPVPEDG